jgi:hypothetical protein
VLVRIPSVCQKKHGKINRVFIQTSSSDISFVSFSFIVRQKLVDTPFTSLTQDYSKCSDTPVFVFLTQIGSALGSMDVIFPLSIFSTIFILYVYQKLTGNQIPESYSKDERDQALSALAVSLLLVRDKERRNSEKKLKYTYGPVSGSENNHNDSGKMDEHERQLQEQELIRRQTIREKDNQVLVSLVHSLHMDSDIHGDAHKLKEKVENIYVQPDAPHSPGIGISMKSMGVSRSERNEEHRSAKVVPFDQSELA